MNKLAERLLQKLEERRGDPERLEAFLQGMMEDPKRFVASLGIEVPAGADVSSIDNPQEIAGRILGADGVEPADRLEKRLREFAGNWEFVVPSTRKDDSMPPGAVELNEKQLKRIVG